MPREGAGQSSGEHIPIRCRRSWPGPRGASPWARGGRRGVARGEGSGGSRRGERIGSRSAASILGLGSVVGYAAAASKLPILTSSIMPPLMVVLVVMPSSYTMMHTGGRQAIELPSVTNSLAAAPCRKEEGNLPARRSSENPSYGSQVKEDERGAIWPAWRGGGGVGGPPLRSVLARPPCCLA